MARENKRNRDARRLAEQLTALQVSKTTLTQHSGPLPHPDVLAGYEKLVPGLADRIVRMAESESAHRRDLESRFLNAQIEDNKTDRLIEGRGQVCALIVALVTIIGGFVIIGTGHAMAGSLLSGGTLLTLVGIFIYGRERARTAAIRPQEHSQNRQDRKQIPEAGP